MPDVYCWGGFAIVSVDALCLRRSPEQWRVINPFGPAPAAWASHRHMLADARLDLLALADEVRRLSELVDSYSAVPFRCDDCQRKLSATEIMNVRR